MTRARTGLDWSSAAHWGGGRRLPCVHCGKGAFCRDDDGRPSHKTCAEAVMQRTHTHSAPNAAETNGGAALDMGSDAA